MLDKLIERFRTWNHDRLALREGVRVPLTKPEKRRLCRKLGAISDRGINVTDQQYQDRLAAVRGEAR
jgi:hypothetical protein